MMKILHVAASPRRRSRSRRLAAEFLDSLGDVDVTDLDVWTADLPELAGETVEGRYRLIHGEAVPDEVASQWGLIRAVADQAMAHDLWVVSTPMWNFGVPYRLKQWIDCVIHPGMTFTNDQTGAVTGLAAGKTAVLVGAGALDFVDIDQEAALDFQMRYLATIFGFIGISDLHTVRAAPTFGSADQVEQAEAKARDQLAAVARTIRARAGGPG